MVSCKDLSVSLQGRSLLGDISFQVRQGSLCVLLGKNGSGKTTLLRALSGALPYEGSLMVGGRELRSLPPRERAKSLALMAQNLPAPAIPLRRLLSFGRQPYCGFSGMLSPADWQVVDRVLAGSGLAPLENRLVSQLSGGQRRKAFFAMLLVQEAPLILADEPCANLDSEVSKEILALLRGRRDQGDTVLCVLHDLNQALEIADQLLVLDQGQLCFDGSPEAFCAADLPKKLFGLEALHYVDEAGREGYFYR